MDNTPEVSNEQKANHQEKVKLDEILKSLFVVSKKVLITMMSSLFHENFDAELTEVTLIKRSMERIYTKYC